MAETTDFLSLVKPGGGSTGLITPPDRVDIDVLNDNFQKIDDWAETIGGRAGRNFNFRGPAASLGGLTGIARGDRYQETDGSFWLWEYDGSNWVSARSGMFIIRPTSVAGTGVTIDSFGRIAVAAGAAGLDAIQVNGVFSARFKHYHVVVELTHASSGLFMQFRAAGAAITTNSNDYTYLWNNATNPGLTSNTSQSSLTLSVNAATDHRILLDIFDPFISGQTRLNVSSNMFAASGMWVARGAAVHRGTIVADGFQIGGSAASALNGTVTVYGVL